MGDWISIVGYRVKRFSEVTIYLPEVKVRKGGVTVILEHPFNDSN